MFRNYLKMVLRTMGRQKLSSSIKIGGFALGLVTSMVIYLFIQNELNDDRHYKNESSSKDEGIRAPQQNLH
ncbi:MAG: hypothetical protein ABIS36_04400 [Chryseolinea sp.]